MSDLFSPAHLDYGLDTLFGRITKSVDCRLGLEPVEGDPYRFAVRVPAPLPEDLDQAKTVVVRVEGRRLQGTVRHTERLDDESLKLEVEPD
ncbi:MULTISPECIES: hypothetical protein [Pseudomonas]|uniref:Uncharacterized protein n=2 Tax=Pseudomonas TaxID=286 RepID=A0AA94JF68_9PSED|nr:MULTISPECIES: hypothetical protein [Pseudomonas]MBT9265267.1 hypothetical protein [Pseudomonas sp. MG-9]RVD74898.1 hypothetical protein A9HBioS_5241 [Pseudomonas koreensis]WDR38284.1 hypothetical protein NN484_11260 [Pseudomonas serboccidentalis]